MSTRSGPDYANIRNERAICLKSVSRFTFVSPRNDLDPSDLFRTLSSVSPKKNLNRDFRQYPHLREGNQINHLYDDDDGREREKREGRGMRISIATTGEIRILMKCEETRRVK